MSFDKQKKEIIDICKNLLSEKRVKVILGFTEGATEGSSSAHFIRNEKDLELFKWDEQCTTNLSKYLLEKRDSVAIIAKACDARAIVMYIAENQLDRKNVYIIGVECAGMKGKDGSPDSACEVCKIRIPPLYDVLVKFNEDGSPIKGFEKDGKPLLTKEQMCDYEAKLDQFQKEMEKCILCYSCRQACFGCYCETCFMDKNTPNWLPRGIDIGAKMVFHLGRAMHLAGRCVECGACERACPSNVKIHYLQRELSDFCEELYGYIPGENPDETPAMSTFDVGDREVGFLGGERHDSCCDSKE